MYLNQSAAQTATAPLRESVNSGQVSLNPEAGDKLTKVLNAQLDQTDAWLERINRLARPAPLGANPVGAAMSQKFESLASGDETSFHAVITAYREVLRQTQEAIGSAIRNTRAADEDLATTFRTQII